MAKAVSLGIMLPHVMLEERDSLRGVATLLVREARIVGGMHLRTSNIAGEKLGVEVARIAARRLDERR